MSIHFPLKFDLFRSNDFPSIEPVEEDEGNEDEEIDNTIVSPPKKPVNWKNL